MEKERVHWVDVAKCIGIYCIYLGHYGKSAGHGHSFVFAFHVPLFFFLAGCMESLNKEKSVVKNITKKIHTLIVPLFIFGTVSIIVNVLIKNCSIGKVKSHFLLLLQGCVRNKFFAGSLWFLTCLFVIFVIFYFIKKTENMPLIFLLCFAMYILSDYFLRPISYPKWYYNIDSALYYIIYFVLGYMSFKKINTIMQSDKTTKWIKVSGIIALVYAALLFFGHDLLGFMTGIRFIWHFRNVMRAIILIWLCIVIAYFLEDVELFRSIGKNTLYICGSEYIVKTFISSIAQVLGLKIIFPNPLCVYLYSFFLLVVVNRYFVPIEKDLIKRMDWTTNCK